MHRPCSSVARHPAGRLFGRLLLLVAVLLATFAVPDVRAEGSREATLSGGYRVYLEYQATGQTAGVPRRNLLYVYANPGEAVSLGSSAMGIGASGDILIQSPAGLTTTCKAMAAAQGAPADYGRIDNRAEELAGPLPNSGGYTPCVISAAMTTTAGAGVWAVQMVSPAPATNTNPPPVLANAAWAQSATSFWIAAWDITVRSAAGAVVPGRAFANYLPLNVGNNASAGSPIGVSSSYFMLTYDGYGYQVDLNGIDPFGFIFFANAEGITDAAGVPLYRSLQLAGDNPGVLPAGYRVHTPTAADNPAARDITHKIFFQAPAADLPASAPVPGGGSTWLLTPSVAPATPTSFAFVGAEGTPGQAGTVPLSGRFTFNSTLAGGFRIVIDANRDGVFGNANDRTIAGSSVVGANSVIWDGYDGFGAPVPAGEGEYNAEITAYAGEIHFPFLDPENNLNGLVTQRLRDPGTVVPAPDPFLVYYDDTYRYSGTGAYTYSLCGAGQTPVPPAGANIDAPSCYGTGPTPRAALNGVSSRTGAHGWSALFGDRRAMDTWSYYPSVPVRLPGALSLRQADLQIVKSHAPEPPIPGAAFTYTIRVSNAGPSAANGARVQDTVPAAILGTTWSCQPTRGSATCGTAGGSGNTIDLLVNLPAGAEVTITAVGTLSSSASGTLTNTATVARPPDVTDPDPGNNTAIDTTTIPNRVDLQVSKVGSATTIAPGQLVTYSLAYTNTGNVTATGVALTERVPAGSTFDAAGSTPGWSCANGSPAGTTCTLARPNLASGASGTATFAVRVVAVPPGGYILNTVTVADDGANGEDPTPGNNTFTTDTPRLTAPDLTIVKTDKDVTGVPGAPVVYELTYQNIGATQATGVVIAETVPTNTTFAAGSSTPGWSCADGAAAGTTCTRDLGTVPGQAGGSVSFAVRLDTPLPAGVEQIANTATIGGNEPDLTPNNNSSSDTTPVNAAPDMTIAKTTGSDFATPGGTIGYNLAYRNIGNQDATGVVVTERVPTNTSFSAAGSSPGWSCADGAVAGTLCTISIGAVAANTGGVRSFAVFVGTPLQSGVDAVVNDVSIADDGRNGADPTPPNNVDGVSTRAAAAPDLTLVKTGPAGPVTGGDILTYTLAYQNVGAQDATGVTVVETVPANTVFRTDGSTPGWSCADGAPAGTLCRLLLGSLPAGGGGELTFVAQVLSPLPAGATRIVNVAMIGDDGANGEDPTPENNDDDADTTLPPTAVTLTRFAAAREGDAVVVRWSTGAELGTAGFHLWRSADGSRAGAVRVTGALLVARGSAGAGAEYSWRDTGAALGGPALYWLEEVESGGRSAEYGPARYTPAGTASGGLRVYLPLVGR